MAIFVEKTADSRVVFQVEVFFSHIPILASLELEEVKGRGNSQLGKAKFRVFPIFSSCFPKVNIYFVRYFF